ncbi:Inhibitor of apoptosis-promoting Bax1 [Popillia japonica]|uniref:Inhibitor of apoptosis-promoting Bax1 n=1 Tax=Popillia japonica TaxID=7064 RepID=A0AAW1I8H9_POPJA
MSNWNNPGYPPPGGYPNQQYPPYPGAPQSGFPQQGYPPPTGYPGAPPQGYPPYSQPGYPGGDHGYPAAPQPGFVPQPTGHYGHDAPVQQGETTPFSHRTDMYGTPYEDESVKGFDFTDQSIRRGFIRKVYAILCAQLCVTLGFIAWFLFHDATRNYVQNNPALLIISFVVMFVTLIAITCCGEVRRKSPMNFILLGLFTLAESFMLGCTASKFNSQEVILAVGITAAVCLALTLFAFQTKWDFTTCTGFLFVAVIVLFLFGILAIIFHNRILTLVYACAGALIFSFYLVYDTQLMMGGQRKYSLSPEEYIFAALSLYLDMTRIFLYILTIIGVSRN